MWMKKCAGIRAVKRSYFDGISMGLTLPQSALLKTDVTCMVYSMGRALGPICMEPRKWTLVVVWSESDHVDSTEPLPAIMPVHTQSALMPPALICILDIWH